MSEERANHLLQTLGEVALAEAFREPEQIIAGVFASSSVGLAIVDQNLRYLAVNQALAEMNGIPPREHLGKTLQQVLGDAASVVQPAFERVLSTGEPILNHELEATLPTRTDPGHWIEHYFPIKDAAGQVTQVGAVIVELTQQKQLKAALLALNDSLQREMERLEVLLGVNASLVSNYDVRSLFPVIADFVRKAVHHEFSSITLFDEGSQNLRVLAFDDPSEYGLLHLDMTIPLQGSVAGSVFLSRKAHVFDTEEMAKYPFAVPLLQHGVRSVCSVPLISRKGPLGTLNLGSSHETALSPHDLGLLQQVADALAVALDNARAYQEIAELKDKLAAEKLYLQSEIRSVLNFEEIEEKARRCDACWTR